MQHIFQADPPTPDFYAGKPWEKGIFHEAFGFAMIETEPIVEVDSCDEPSTKIVGFYCNGHIDKREFLNSKQLQEYVYEYNEYREIDFQPELIFQPSQVQHTYWRVEKFEPDERNCDCEIFDQCEADAPGATAVTVINI